MELKQGTINIANSEQGINIRVSSKVSLPIKQGEESIQASPFNGSLTLNQQQALMLYLSSQGAIPKLKLQQGSVELLAQPTDRALRLRFTDYSNKQRTLYILSSQALLDFLFSLKAAIPRPIHYFHHPNAVVDITNNSLSVSTPSGYTVLKDDALAKFRFFLSKVVEGFTGRLAFGLEGVSFGQNRLFIAGRSFSVVNEVPLLGRKINEFVYVLHTLLNI